MTTYIELGNGAGGSGASAYYGNPVANFAALPISGAVGELRLALDTGVIYYWDSASWNVAETEVATVAHSDTDSIDLDTTGSILTATLNISTDAASAGYIKATTTIKSGAGNGIHVESPIPTIDTLAKITDGATADGDTYVLGGKSATAALANTAATNVWGSQVSLALTAGTYLVTGVMLWNDSAANLNGRISAGFSKASDATGIGTYDYIQFTQMLSEVGSDMRSNLPSVILGDSGAFTVHLNVRMIYDAGQPQAGGKIVAIRIR